MLERDNDALRARVAELEAEIAQGEQLRETLRESNERLVERVSELDCERNDMWAKCGAAQIRTQMVEKKLAAAESRASAAEQRVKRLEGALEKADAMFKQIRAFGLLPGVARTDEEIDAEALAYDLMDDAADKFDAARAALAASDEGADAEVSHG